MSAVQIEQLWGTVYHLSFLMVISATGYCLARFVKPFLPGPKRAWPVGVSYGLVMGILYCIPQELPAFPAYCTGTAAAFAVLYGLDRRNVRQKLFLAVTFLTLRYLSLSMENNIYFVLHGLTLDPPAVAARPLLQLGLFALLRLFDVGLSFGFMALSAGLILKAYRNKAQELTGRELLLLLTPSLSALLMQQVLHYYADGLPGLNMPGEWLRFLSEGIAFCAILATIVLFAQVKARGEEEKQWQLLLGQVEDIRRHIGEVEKLYRDARTLRHDLGKHIQTLSALHARGERAAAEAYAAELTGRLHASLPEIKTGNPVTDVILSEKSREAEERGIAFQWDFHYPENAGFDAFDIGVILHNILSNAL